MTNFLYLKNCSNKLSQIRIKRLRPGFTLFKVNQVKDLLKTLQSDKDLLYLLPNPPPH